MESIAMTRQQLDGDKMIVNMGPSHPTTHGTLRIVLELEGETITKATPEMGYLHRGVEKLGESLSYQQFIPLTDRLNYCSSIMNNVGYTTAVEKLLGIEIPKRAQQIRVLVSELARIADHLVCVGVNAVDIGAFTAFLYLFRQRETIYDLFEMAAGQRLHTSFTRIGGLFRDIPEGFVPLTERFLVISGDVLTDIDLGHVITTHEERGALATIGLMTGLAYWNDWINGLYYISDPSLYGIQQLLIRILDNIQFLKSGNAAAVVGTVVVDLPGAAVRMALAVIGILPVLIVFPWLQKYLIRGMVVGAVKG